MKRAGREIKTPSTTTQPELPGLGASMRFASVDCGPDSLEPHEARRILTVSEVTHAIREVLETGFSRILVRGEITNLSRPHSGHVYFSLVDDEGGSSGSRLTAALLPCVLWRSSAERLKLDLTNGLKVVVGGRIGVYEPRGTYQLIADRVELAGLGELQRLFEELKERLRQEGLFSPERKRALPFLPRRIGLITSPTGAAIQDVLRALFRRFPRAWVRIVPVRVQGEGAAAEITRALEVLQSGDGQVDVVVLARGGGSLEDLWAFNDERLARAIAASRIPTVSAVGHEVDFSISDFVADVRAQTPTKAAEIVVPELEGLLEGLEGLSRRMVVLETAARSRRATELGRLVRRRPLRDPQVIVQERVEHCDDLARHMKIHLYNRPRQWEDALSSICGRLEALNPLKVLARGYSVTTDSEGHIVRDASTLAVGQALNVELARGLVHAQIMGLDVTNRHDQEIKELTSAKGGCINTYLSNRAEPAP